MPIKTIQQIDKEVDDFLISRKIEDDEKELRDINLKKIEKEFIEEVTIENPDWVKERKLDFLNSKLNFFNKQCILMINFIEKYKRHKIEKNIFTYKEYVWSLEKKIKSIKTQIDLWENPAKIYDYESSNLTEEQIQEAREADCSLFMEFEKQDNNKAWAKCPFHNEKTPSFCYFKESKSWYCFGCGEHGNTIDLVMRLQNVDFQTAVRTILNNL